MRVKLERYAYSPSMGVFGTLHVRNERFYTVERPWLDNEPYYSCIPEGRYQAEMLPTTTPVPSEFDGKTWYLHGGSVGINVGLRTRIAIHIANTMDDVQGCIGVGMNPGCVNHKWAVIRSGDALSRLLEILPDSFEVNIVRISP